MTSDSRLPRYSIVPVGANRDDDLAISFQSFCGGCLRFLSGVPLLLLLPLVGRSLPLDLACPLDRAGPLDRRGGSRGGESLRMPGTGKDDTRISSSSELSLSPQRIDDMVVVWIGDVKEPAVGCDVRCGRRW